MFDATPFLRQYSRIRWHRLLRKDPIETQRSELSKLLRTAANCRFGREHDFAKLRTVEDYQRACPIRSYETFWERYWKSSFPLLVDQTWPGKIPYFAVSSGTSSGTTKYIPLTRAMMRSNVKAGTDLLVYHLVNRPGSKLFAGKNFILGGSTELVEHAPGVYSGDLSGISMKELPAWARARSFPPKELAFIKDWETKLERFIEAARNEDIRSMSGVPSWMILFLKQFAEREGSDRIRIAELFPKLEMIVHGGVNFQPYRTQFDEMLEGSRAELREVYPASEGFIAIADRGAGDGMRLNIDHGIFYEFVPLEELGAENPVRHWLGTIEPDVNYAIVMTTCAGLWSYLIGDTVRFVETNPPRLLVTGRISYSLSAFGEHLIAEEIEDAVSQAATAIGRSISDYSVGPVFPDEANPLGGHVYVVEFREDVPPSELLQRFAEVLDETLCRRNEDYEAHRAGGFGLRSPNVRAVAPGTFNQWMKSRGKLGGQNKVPRIINDQNLLEDLISFSNV